MQMPVLSNKILISAEGLFQVRGLSLPSQKLLTIVALPLQLHNTFNYVVCCLALVRFMRLARKILCLCHNVAMDSLFSSGTAMFIIL